MRWAKEHQVVAFFTVALALNFGLGIPGLMLSTRESLPLEVVGFYLVRISLFSPVLAGLLIARLADSRVDDRSRSARRLTFLVVWVLAWIIGTLYLRTTIPAEAGLSIPVLVVLNAPLALLPAFVFAGAFSGVASIRRYLGTLVRPRGRIIWYLVAVFTFPAVHLVGNAITRLQGAHPAQADGVSVGLVWVAVITFLHVFLFTGGINEESGWRGFVLPRLQARRSPLIAALIIWSCHVVWELNGDVVSDVIAAEGVSWPVISRLVWMPCWTILFIWVYNRTGGCILAPALFHASMNMMNPLMVVLPTTTAGTVVLIVVALFAIAYDRMWKRLPADSSAVSLGA